MKAKIISLPAPTLDRHTHITCAFAELNTLQIALLLDSVLHTTTQTGYIENADLNELKEGLSQALALSVIGKAY